MQEVSVQAITDIERLKEALKYEEAKETIQKLLVRFPDDYRLYEELADILVYENDFSEAGKLLAIAQKLHPESATGMYLQGYICVTQGKFDTGVELLEKANSLSPNNAEILRNLGW